MKIFYVVLLTGQILSVQTDLSWKTKLKHLALVKEAGRIATQLSLLIQSLTSGLLKTEGLNIKTKELYNIALEFRILKAMTRNQQVNTAGLRNLIGI